MKLRVECQEKGCDQYSVCGERFVELGDQKYRESLHKAVLKKEGGKIHLDVCPRFGELNPLCFILQQVNGVHTKHYTDYLSKRIETLRKRMVEKQDAHRDIIREMTLELNKHITTLGAISGESRVTEQTN